MTTLDADVIVAEAQRATGLADFGDDTLPRAWHWWSTG